MNNEKEMVVNLLMIAGMQKNIIERGHILSWFCIERMENPKIRFAYRTLFLRAGGLIPAQHFNLNFKEE